MGICKVECLKKLRSADVKLYEGCILEWSVWGEVGNIQHINEYSTINGISFGWIITWWIYFIYSLFFYWLGLQTSFLFIWWNEERVIRNLLSKLNGIKSNWSVNV